MTIAMNDIPATASAELAQLIESRQARVGIIGLGYVGLPLAVEFAQAGFHVTGLDLQADKVSRINNGESYIRDVKSADVRDLVKAGRLRATTDLSSIAEFDTVNICVPTPLRKTKDPDMTYVEQACQAVAAHLRRNMLIILESTTYPGTTEELVLPMISKSGLKIGKDFFLCFSPERVDPGNQQYQTRTIPKVVGGITAECTKMGGLFYSQCLDSVVPVSSTQVAEMVKLLENTFRMINIGLANEMALMCDRMGINVWEVIEAAATKPFGFMPFYPGPGLGGHCIPIDPFYLSWKTKQAGIEARFIELAGYINGQMPLFVVEKIQNALNDVAKPLRGSHVHLLGVTYKKDVEDLRESPALDIAGLLARRGSRVTFSDPYVNSINVNNVDLQCQDMLPAVKTADCTVIVTDHTGTDYAAVADCAKLIVDTRNALRGIASDKIIRL